MQIKISSELFCKLYELHVNWQFKSTRPIITIEHFRHCRLLFVKTTVVYCFVTTHLAITSCRIEMGNFNSNQFFLLRNTDLYEISGCFLVKLNRRIRGDGRFRNLIARKKVFERNNFHKFHGTFYDCQWRPRGWNKCIY